VPPSLCAHERILPEPIARRLPCDQQHRSTPREIRQICAARRNWETCEVPSIPGRVEVNLTVRDPLLSAAWYAELLGMQTRYAHTSDDGQMRYICLVEPSSSLVLCLVGHAKSTGEPFTEFRTGLDHLEFLVASRDDLEHWAERLDELGVPHSGVKNPGYTANAMLTFRDPDNIQLEFFWRATVPEGA
jgi:catechol 2,3-dioxygenase-like lactoylglutathione lyase family enzyme